MVVQKYGGFDGSIGHIYVYTLKTKNLRKRKLELIQTVRERTMEINEQNEELNQQNEEILAQRDEIERQKRIVENWNTEIKASIVYAERIQNTILPQESDFKRLFPESFIYYQPKDIVSGDFYWVAEKNGARYVAVVDCTGHGVPGAFVSIIGYNGLHRCLNEFDLDRPAEILDKLTDIVIETFQKGQHDVMDGMDIAMLRIEGDEVQFAGANNPLYLVKKENVTVTTEDHTPAKNGKSIHKIKGDRQPVGAFFMRKKFTNHTFRLEKNDMFYLFTDGFADQFGGPRHKKFTYKRLREKLTLISEEDMELQRSHLEATFLNWKKFEEQLDDICIIGIKP